jgi:hypothetical protein
MIPPKFEHGGLVIRTQVSPETTTVRWLGVSDAREPAVHLTPFLSSILDELANRSVTVDFREFEYMNSATVSPLINFV